jgi:hypothetical protein
VDFEYGWVKKSSFIAKDEMKVCQPRPKSHKKNKVIGW